MRMGPVFFLAAFSPAVLYAQREASLGVGVGAVRYAGDSNYRPVATVSPAVLVISPSFYVGAGGSLSMLQGGVWAAQGRTDLWAAFPRDRVTGPRIALSVNLAASTRSDGVAGGAGSAVAEVVWARGRGGGAIGAGPGTGVIEGERGVGAPHLRARGWWLNGPAQLSLSVEPIRITGAWYTDVVGGATLDRGRVVASAWATARLSSAYGSKGAASAALQYFVSPAVAGEAAAGGYLSDPFPGLPRAGVGSARLRPHSTPRGVAPAPALPPRPAPLLADGGGAGDSVVARVRLN